MNVSSDGDSPGARPVIVIGQLDADAPRAVELCLASLCDHASGAQIHIYGTADPRAAAGRESGAASGKVTFVRTAASFGEVVERTAPHDLILVSARCVVAPHWLTSLRTAAYADTRNATASPIELAGVPGAELGQSIASFDPGKFEAAAEALRAQSLLLRPRIAQPCDTCTYIRRSALALVDGRDPVRQDFADGALSFYEASARFGLLHVVADDALVVELAPGPDPETRSARVTRGTRSGPTARVKAATTPVQEQALGKARRSLVGLSVAVDATCLSAGTTGTQVHTIELLAALVKLERTEVTALTPRHVPSSVADAVARLGIRSEPYDEAIGRSRHRFDVIHRPYQPTNLADLQRLRAASPRLVVTLQDLISYHNRSYFGTEEEWESHRWLMRLTGAMADHVTFLSDYARGDALSEGLVDHDRSSVVAAGVDHVTAPSGPALSRPAGLSDVSEQTEAILCLGTDFSHKNRLFALRVLRELRGRYSWAGLLIFAGQHVKVGSSSADEAALLAAEPELAPHCIDVGPVTNDEREWLLTHSRLVLYPTTSEGFGLVPFEAASRDTPCLWAPVTALAEVLPSLPELIVPWDPVRTAAVAHRLLSDVPARQTLVSEVKKAAANYTWEGAATRLLDIYEHTCDQPGAAAGAGARADGPEPGGLTEDGIRLVGPGGLLPADVQRPLVALAAHPGISAPVFALVRYAYAASQRARGYLRPKG